MEILYFTLYNAPPKVHWSQLWAGIERYGISRRRTMTMASCANANNAMNAILPSPPPTDKGSTKANMKIRMNKNQLKCFIIFECETYF